METIIYNNDIKETHSITSQMQRYATFLKKKNWSIYKDDQNVLYNLKYSNMLEYLDMQFNKELF